MDRSAEDGRHEGAQERLVEDGRLSRRSLLKLGGIGAGAMMVPGLLGAATSYAAEAHTAASESPALKKALAKVTEKEVIIANYGGSTEEARRKVYWTPFEELTGIKVVETEAGALAIPMLEGEVATKWDAVHGSSIESYAAQKHGKKKLPKTPSAAWEDLIPKQFQPYMWQSFFISHSPAYLTATFKGKDKPRTWADFYDTKKFPGKRGFPGVNWYDGTREGALMAAGVSPEKLYPLDIKKADSKIKSIWSDLTFWEEFPQAESLLSSNAVAICMAPNGLWKELKDKGVDVTVMWEATPVIEANGFNILPEPPNPKAVEALAIFCNNPRLQAQFSALTNYGPSTKAAFKKMSGNLVKELPNAPDHHAVEGPAVYLAESEAKLAADNKKLFS